MKSGMIVNIKPYGQVQVIGELDNRDIWGLALIDEGRVIMSPSKPLTDKVLNECKRVTNTAILEKAKLMQSDLSNRLDWIKESSEKIKGENIDVTV